MGVQLPSKPITRKEKYLAKAAGQAVEVPAEPITREEAYLNAIAQGGGGGGTSNYENLSNQPQVNGEILIGDKTGADLGLVDAEEGKGLSTNDYDDNEKAAVAAATSAISAMKDGTDLDSFGDVEVALLDKADTADLGTAAAKNSTNAVTAGSTDLVESGAVKDAIDAAVAAAYHHAGTKTVAQLTHDLLVAANEGNVYNITDSGTTTSDFIEGIGKTIDEGSNVGICKVGNTYMFDLLSGFVDTTNFVQKSVTAGLLKNDGTVNDEIEGDVATLKSGLINYQTQNDLNLEVPNRKNMLPMTVSGIKSANRSGTWNGNTYTFSTITMTIDTDSNGNVKSITLNGTGNNNIYLAVSDKFTAKTNADVILSGANIGVNSLYMSDETIPTDITTAEFTTTAGHEYVAVYHATESSYNNFKLYPMIRPATITDPTFAPYIPSVESRIEAVDVSAVKNVTIENGSSIYDWLRNTSNKSGMYLIGATNATDNPFGTSVPAMVVCMKVWKDGSYSQLFAYGGSRNSTNFKKSDLIYPADVSIPWET